ncbi:hypothetical protein, partial [Klebsiella pneumoniae]|uniref:hypothetical protein n=1 Tax=Klebsiella pneumoniae TaxID=573 RepID=UPI0025A1BF30
REFTYIGSLNKHAAFSCPKKPLSPSKRKVSHSSKKVATHHLPAVTETVVATPRHKCALVGKELLVGRRRWFTERPQQTIRNCSSP